MQPLGFLEGENRFPKVVVHADPALGAILPPSYDAARVLGASPLVLALFPNSAEEEFREVRIAPVQHL